MFFKKKFVKEAKEWLRVAHKIRHYRKDILQPELYRQIEAEEQELKQLLKQKPLLNKAITEVTRKLERTLGKTQCPYATRRALSENVEIIIVAAILAMGARTFFLQPFQIPTNSMYPTYSGMYYEIIENPPEEPGIRAKLRSTLKRTTGRFHVQAPASGEIRLELLQNAEGRFFQRPQIVKDRKWLLLPSEWSVYRIGVGNAQATIQVPKDFNYEAVTEAAFGPYDESKMQQVNTIRDDRGNEYRVYIYNTGVNVGRGDPVLVFNILPGDMLFVDRLSYHFVEPQIGDPFVFKTDDITTIAESERGQYYIKRLVGEGGDRLQVKPPVLLRNGAPIEGAEAFRRNAELEGEYEGYSVESGMRFLDWENAVTIPEDHYFAMGDNSDESSDGRMWGYVPKKSVIGKALLIYYPFTSRMGLAE